MTGLLWIGIALLALNSVLLVRIVRKPKEMPIPPPPPPQPELSQAAREHLEQQASATFQAAITKSTSEFGKDLEATSTRLNSLIVKLTTETVERELQDYKQAVESARTGAVEALQALQKSMLEHQKSLQQDTESDVAEHRKQLIERIDQRLGEAALAYITESLGQGADLGAQRTWILESLERHKADLKKDLTDAA